jgi:hypothetical protein
MNITPNLKSEENNLIDDLTSEEFNSVTKQINLCCKYKNAPCFMKINTKTKLIEELKNTKVPHPFGDLIRLLPKWDTPGTRREVCYYLI